MPELLVPGKKPIGTVKIDFNNPYARDLRLCTLFQSGNSQGRIFINDLTGLFDYALTPTDNNAWYINSANKYGYGVKAAGLAGPSTWAFNGVIGKWPAGSTNFTTVAGIVLNAVDANSEYWSQEFQLAVQILDITTTSATVRHAFEGAWSVGDAVVTNTLSESLLVPGWTFNNGVGRLYVNGKFYHTKTGSSTIALTTNPVFLIKNESTKGNVLHFLYAWNRTLSDQEMADIYTNPYQFLIPA